MTAVGIWAASRSSWVWQRVILVAGGLLAAILLHAMYDYGVSVPTHRALTDTLQICTIVCWAGIAYAIAGRAPDQGRRLP